MYLTRVSFEMKRLVLEYAILPFAVIIMALGGCTGPGSQYREFVKTVDFSDFGSYLVEGPLPPVGLDARLKVGRYDAVLLETLKETMDQKGFVGGTGLADVDMVMEMQWNATTVRKPGSQAKGADRPPEIEYEKAFRLTVRVYDPKDGDLFWMNSGNSLNGSFMTQVGVVNSLNNIMKPFPERAGQAVGLGKDGGER